MGDGARPFGPNPLALGGLHIFSRRGFTAADLAEAHSACIGSNVSPRAGYELLPSRETRWPMGGISRFNGARGPAECPGLDGVLDKVQSIIPINPSLSLSLSL